MSASLHRFGKRRFRSVAMIVIVATAISPGWAGAVDGESIPPSRTVEPTLDAYSTQLHLQPTQLLFTDPGQLLADNGDDIYISDVYDVERKSPKRAFVQSLIVPGWGQWYNGSRLKPFLFLGLEAGGWYGWSHFRGSGRDIEAEYRAFANTVDGQLDRPYWDYQTYIDSLRIKYYNGVAVDDDRTPYPNPNAFEPGEPDSLVFSHHIPLDDDGNPILNDEYYENIGKYDQFQFGWNDYTDSLLALENGQPTVHKTARDVSPNRLHYVKRREDANSEFGKATNFAIGVIANHLIAAFEGALGARSYNRRQDQFGAVDVNVRMVNIGSQARLYPKFYVSYRF